MSEPTLQFLGEQIARIQAELRELHSLRGDVAHLRAEAADLRDETAHLRGEMMEFRSDMIGFRGDMIGFQGETGNRFTVVEQAIAGLTRSVDAQFAHTHQTMATNLALVLAAIKDDD